MKDLLTLMIKKQMMRSNYDLRDTIFIEGSSYTTFELSDARDG